MDERVKKCRDGKEVKVTNLRKLLEKNKRPSHPTSDMYAVEKGKDLKRRFYP